MSRIDALIAAMSLEEKIGQLCMVSADLTPLGPVLGPDALNRMASGAAGSVLSLWGVERTLEARRRAMEGSRLGIPLLIGFDVLHGHRTIFPIPLGETAAFDPSLWEATARAAAEEAAAEDVDLTFAPMVDVSRDLRWGRIAESPGEDPWIASRAAVAKVRGFQGDLAEYDPQRVAATAKHLAAYGASVAGRDYAGVDISERTLHEVYLAPFEAAVRAGVAAIMPAFISLAGTPMTAHRRLLRDVVRGQWGFDGVIVSDYLAVAELITHGIAADAAEAAAAALLAGVDIDMVSPVYANGLPVALERGLVQVPDIDASVRRVLALKERLGLFEGRRARAPHAKAATSDAATRALARDTARRSIVLLKNDDGVLPLAAAARRIALVGPLADAAQQMLGPWAGAGTAKGTVTIFDGMRAALPGCDIRHAPGAPLHGTDAPDFSEVRTACRGVDLIVACLGEAADMSGEAASRARPALPVPQQALADALLALGPPVVLLLSSGRPLIVTRLVERAQAVLATWFLGSEAGNAIADVLSGRADPVGRLPVTWPRDVGQAPIYFAEWPTGRPPDATVHYSSKFIDLPPGPLYPFGHGLSYTRFEQSNLRLRSHVLAPRDTLVAEVDVHNAGERAGEQTLFLFVHDVVASAARPLLELKAMTKLRLAPGERATAVLSVSAAELAFLDAHLQRVLEPGRFDVCVGPTADPATALKASFELRAA
jgi:beta-glucosidase